jgi:hypothetical protein
MNLCRLYRVKKVYRLIELIIFRFFQLPAIIRARNTYIINRVSKVRTYYIYKLADELINFDIKYYIWLHIIAYYRDKNHHHNMCFVFKINRIINYKFWNRFLPLIVGNSSTI